MSSKQRSQASGGDATVPPVAGDLVRTVQLVTPECATLEFELAGPGSRFAALLVDAFWQLGLLLVVVAVALAPLGWARLAAFVARYVWPTALVAAWLVLWGYYVLFETVWNGQTPGKRSLRLRVVRDGGYPAGFAEAALRNVLRPVDLLPWVAPYLLGGVVMATNSRFKRLGDLVAGTVVIRERRTSWVETLVSGHQDEVVSEGAALTPAQLDEVTPEEAAALGRYLSRRAALPLSSRRDLAARLAQPLRARMHDQQQAEAGPDADDMWLEAVYAQWVARRRGVW